ncbi:MAG: PHP domain-containing protein [Candidatus Moduliflexus flocculans]|nr:PHP domain-containing protein [Candidatus Moduliflexus flocculans]
MFVPLRIHSVYSRGRGSVTLEEASGWAAAQRLPAAGLADIGNIYGWGKWKRVAPAGGYRPLFGCELEVGGRRFVFLVRTREGYSNLMEIFNRRGDPRHVGTRRDLRAGRGRRPAGRGRRRGTAKTRDGGPAGRARRRCWPSCARRSRRAICTSGRSSRISSVCGNLARDSFARRLGQPASST